MKQNVNVLIPTDLIFWAICEKERNRTTLSQVFVKALQAYKDSKEAKNEVFENE